MIDIESNKKLSAILIELFLRGRKPKASIVYILPFYFKVPKTIRLNVTRYFFVKIPNKQNFNK